ncbi:MAG: hypothetical protein L0Y64_22555 [Myxococcaceae bacterium]|nr:hypothetical protein [Myxococcaceae bacterium]
MKPVARVLASLLVAIPVTACGGCAQPGPAGGAPGAGGPATCALMELEACLVPCLDGEADLAVGYLDGLLVLTTCEELLGWDAQEAG